MTNLSQWFDLEEQKPWEVGVYEVHIGLKFTDGIKEVKEQFQDWFAFWDGSKFSCSTGDIYRAENMKSVQEGSDVGVFEWRGLSTNPEVKKKQGNRKVTRHVVIDRGGFIDKPVAVFSSKKLAEKYGSNLFAATVKTIRFRTPE